MMELQIYRNGLPYLLVPIDENTYFSQVVMGEHIISSSFILNNPLDIDEGDYVIFRGEQFTINRPLPPIDKSNSFTYKYDLVFEGYVYDMLDKIFRHLGSMEFSFFGNAATFIQMVVDNMNEIGEDWAVGTVDVTDEKLIDFFQNGQGYTCKGALIKISEIFTLEFWLTGKTINLTAQAGVQTNLDFEYGRGKGLYKVIRGQIEDQAYFNRIVGQGGTKNIPFDYRGGAKRLMIDGGYLDAAIPDGKKRREGSVILDDIYPHRTGTLTAVSADYLSITDSSIDFDLNGLKIEGSTPVVSFTSGENSGKDFTIADYNHATKTIRLEPLTESDGYILPNSTFEIKVGDKYVLLGIAMPVQYVAAAEEELRVEMLRLLTKAMNNTPPYAVEIDEKYMRDNGVQINAGDRARLKDTPLGIDQMIRVSQVKFPLVNVDKVTIVLSDTITYTNEEISIVDTDKIKKDVTIVDRTNAERARNNSLNMRKLQGRIFNPDGSLFDGVNSIVAGMAAFGFDSQNFGLIDVTISPNNGGDKNALSVSGGKLIHYIYKVDGLGYEWVIPSNSWSGLDSTKFYYVYAKCSKTSLSGTWEISETPVSVNDIAGFWAFNVGQLYEVNADDYRSFEFTKGMTYIVGDQITTGRIKSIDGVNYFDLNTGTFNLQNLLSSFKFDELGITLGGKIISTSAEFIDLLVQNLRTKSTGKRVQILESKNNIEIYNIDEDVLIQLDDDSSFEEPIIQTTARLIPDPPSYIGTKIIGSTQHFYYYSLGPGIRVGLGITDVNGVTTIGRKKVFTTGQFVAGADEEDQTIISKDGIQTTGKSTVKGDSELYGAVKVHDGISLVNTYSGTIDYVKWVDGGADERRKLVVVKGLIVAETAP